MSARPRPSRSSHSTGLRSWLRPLVTPHVFDFWASRVHPLWTWERPLAQLVERRRESCDTVTLLLRPNRHWAGFRPGQHVNLGVEIGGARITRSYSLSQPPRADGLVAITVKQMPGGRVSPNLFERAEKGEIFEIGPAFGDMTLPEQPRGEWLFLAAGSGITPLMSMLRGLAAEGMPVPLALVYWARRREEMCFVDELRALAAAHDGFTLHLLLTREQPREADEHEGRIGEALLSSLVPDLAGRQVMACGPGGFVESARELLDGRVRSFQSEAFTLPDVPVTDEGEVELTLARRGKVLRVPRGRTLLAALEAEGLRPPSGCRMGICNTCACGKSAGSVRHLPSGELVHENMSALKLCIHSAVTDLTLDL
ncbi:ferredoxin reductase [Marilutibacter alkalisoli]|uniref:Ferredoxin reductase n=1 Tax=Marilutibacter alkalisoli TaxID=2591633 RepID=A0A514BSW7_9GAMM|nr:ferredoxin reductase [Lysobacter alkalisoli]QDH70488.1 ferredoxin reductase [Lysobacter alkalisoli]